MIVEQYSPDDQARWDEFVRASKNGTFLLSRGYMDYHADLFQDFSLLIFDENRRLCGVMPANRRDAEVISHGGLTYGGVVSDQAMTTPAMLAVFEALVGFLKQQGVERLIYKTIPSIYSRLPAEEDLYALFRYDASLIRRDVLSVVKLDRRLPYQRRRVRKIELARKLGLVISPNPAFDVFWPVLEANLMRVHGVTPVHSLAEIERLADAFPDNIHLHLVQRTDGAVLAGVVTYVSDEVAHAQYISVSEEGRTCGALDLLFADLLERVYAGKHYFDFGISNENAGRHLNIGLIEQKEGFGARAVIHDQYELVVR